MLLRVGLIGDYDASVLAHQAIPRALSLASEQAGVPLVAEWLPTERIAAERTELLDEFDALWCVPASPYRSMDGALMAIRYARENGVPFLGTCGGFQHALIEYARNVARISNADHAETNPDAETAIVTPLACSLVDAGGTVCFASGTRLREIYGSDTAFEMYRCSYALNPAYEDQLGAGGLRIVARDPDGAARAFELAGHPFYFGTLYQPERSALRNEAHPLITAFVRASALGASSHAASATRRRLRASS